jgi:hypothetical protein
MRNVGWGFVPPKIRETRRYGKLDMYPLRAAITKLPGFKRNGWLSRPNAPRPVGEERKCGGERRGNVIDAGTKQELTVGITGDDRINISLGVAFLLMRDSHSQDWHNDCVTLPMALASRASARRSRKRWRLRADLFIEFPRSYL